MPTFTIVPDGPFSLKESVLFGFGQRHSEPWTGVMRLAFCSDGYRQQVGVAVRQDDAGVHGELSGDANVDVEAVKRQVARVLSLDHDGRVFMAIGERDPVIGRLQAAAPGLRPPLFYSPYEAAVWSILSTRRPPMQAAAVRNALSQRFGRVFDVAGERIAALPTPQQLLSVESFAGIPTERMTRLHGVACAARDGLLDAEKLRALTPEAAMAEVRRLKGIGPFYSMLIVLRGTGFVDVLPEKEPRILGLIGQLYGLGRPAQQSEYEQIAEAWRPMRTWASVLVRAAGPRILNT